MARYSNDPRPAIFCTGCQIPMCRTCQIRPAEKCGQGKNGNIYYRPNCKSCSNKQYGIVDKRTTREKHPWRKLSYKLREELGCCQRCGFIPEDLCQLDTDHIDGNPNNNELINLMVLCANCHRLKTMQNGDGKIKRPRKKKE